MKQVVLENDIRSALEQITTLLLNPKILVHYPQYCCLLKCDTVVV